MKQWNSAPPGQAQLQSATNGQWNMASNRGPNAIGSESYRTGGGNVASGVGGSWGSSQTSVAAASRMAAHNPINPNGVVNISGHPGAANTSGTYEKNIIMELCPPGGMKPEPPPDKLASFCESLPSLNSDLVCPALLDLLEDGQPWVIRAKVLCVMEKAIQIGEEMAAESGGNNPYADFFHICREEVIPLASHARAAVRDPAKRVLKELGLDADIPSAAMSAAPNKAPTAPPVEPPNLLDFDDEPAPREVPAVPTEAPPIPPAVPTPAVPTPATTSLFGGMTVKQSSSAPTPSMAVDSTKASTAPPADFTSNDDLLGVSDNLQPPTQNGPTSSAALFDGLDQKIDSAPESSASEEKATSATVSQSGFSFLNASSSEEKPKSAVANEVSFDPLLNPSTSQSQSPPVNSQMALVMQQQQQQIRMMQAQMQAMQMGNNPQRMMMMQQQQVTPRSNSSGKQVMGGMGGSGVTRSFAFFEDPTKVRKEESNKKFDFVLDAMKGAK